MKLGVPFLQLPLEFDAAALAAEVEAIEASAWRPHPQGYPGNDALLLVTQGGAPDSDGAAGPMGVTDHLRRCPYLMQVMHAIGATWGRSRLMRLSGHAEVTPHVDTNYYWRERARVHVPIVTQPTVRFVCGGAEVNMRAGECWIFDTWSKHYVINDHELARTHLVADTVGGQGFWEHVRAARPHDRDIPGWQPQRVAPVPGFVPELEIEAENFPAVMTPWEVRAQYAFALAESTPHPKLPQISQALLNFSRHWHALWSHYGVRREGWPQYRATLEAARKQLVDLGIDEVLLRNGVRMLDALNAWIFEPGVGDKRDGRDVEVRHRADGAPSAAAPSVVSGTSRDPSFDRPVFIVCAPRSGSTLLFETLAQAPGLYTIGDESHQLIEGIAELAPASREYSSNLLRAADATPAVVTELRQRFLVALRDRTGRPPVAGARVRMLEKTPKNALRIPFLLETFPEARFVYLQRDARQVLASMIEAWQSGRFRTYPRLPGWTGLDWSLLLVPGWRALAGQSLERIVAMQWRAATQQLLDDLERLPHGRWTVAGYDALVANPDAEIRRLCLALELEWDRSLPRVLPNSSYTVSAPDPDKWRRYAELIDAVWPLVQDQARRAEEVAMVASLPAARTA